MLYAAGERTYGADRAREALEKHLSRQPAAENVKLLAAAIAASRCRTLDEARLADQLYVLKLWEHLKEAEDRIGTNAAVNEMATRLKEKDPGELARALALALHLIIHP